MVFFGKMSEMVWCIFLLMSVSRKWCFGLGQRPGLGFPFYTQRCRGAWYGSDSKMVCVLFAIFFCIYYKEAVGCFLDLVKDEGVGSWIYIRMRSLQGLAFVSEPPSHQQR